MKTTASLSLLVSLSAIAGCPAAPNGPDAPIDAKPWFCTSTTISFTPSCTAVTSSCASIKYDPSPTST